MRRWLIRGALALICAGIVTVCALAALIVHYGAKDRARPADVIIVLGGGEIGTTRRAEHAATLYAQGYAPYLLCTGNIVQGEPFSEAERCARVAQAHGIPADVIALDEISLSTEENAIESAAIMRAHGWQDAIIVSDDFHLWRAVWLFRDKGIRAWASPAQATAGPLPVYETVRAVLREVAATGWYVGKSLLGLPYTRVGE